MINVFIFALLYSFSLWKRQILHAFFPSLALLLLAHLTLELANGLDRKLKVPLYIFSFLIYPLSFDFFRFFLQPSFLNGLLNLLLYLYFLRLFLSFHQALVHGQSSKRAKHIERILSSLVFGLIACLVRIDLNSLYSLVQRMNLDYFKALVQGFSPSSLAFFILLHLSLCYLVDLFFTRLLAKR